MAKKRKAPKTFDQPQTTKSTKFDIEERFNDSEDDFYAGRDKILLEESADSKRRRRIVETERSLQPSDEEILGYQEEDDSESQVYSDAGEDDEVDDDGEVEEHNRNAQSRGRKHDPEADEDSEDEHWGADRADYYNADVIETEADALEEEKEARRLHQKQIKAMTEADFGFDENEWAEAKEGMRKSRTLIEKLPEIQIPPDATDRQKLQILQNRYPELRPLAEDFVQLQQRKKELDTQALEISQQISQGRKLAGGLPIAAKRDALTAYLASISMYFAVVASNTGGAGSSSITAMPPLELHEHAVIQTLTTARRLWDRVAEEDTAELQPIREEIVQKESRDPKAPLNGAKNLSVRNRDRSETMTKANRQPTSPESSQNKKLKVVGMDSQLLSEEPISGKKSKKSKSSKGSKNLDLDTLLKEAAANGVDSESDFGDEHPLTEEQYAEKDRKRKSLRFYTSQIASKANKRGHASREAGGDDDLPHKERHRDRQERLMKAAEAKGKGAADRFDDGAEDDDYDEVPNHRRHDDNDDYYNTLLDATNKKKSDKKAKAEAYAAAAQEGAQVYEEETVGADGKRAITYAIAKNKGLAPKRKKEVRNPRVKKRKKFDEKMKKLGSMKQVYKGGEGRGGYGGELTGIKTNIVKSVKL